jgi:hypothetical protein
MSESESVPKQEVSKGDLYSEAVTIVDLRDFEKLLANNNQEETRRVYLGLRKEKLASINANKDSMESWQVRTCVAQVDALGLVLGIEVDKYEVDPRIAVMLLLAGHAKPVIEYHKTSNYDLLHSDSTRDYSARTSLDELDPNVVAYQRFREYPRIFSKASRLLALSLQNDVEITKRVLVDYANLLGISGSYAYEIGIGFVELYSSADIVQYSDQLSPAQTFAKASHSLYIDEVPQMGREYYGQEFVSFCVPYVGRLTSGKMNPGIWEYDLSSLSVSKIQFSTTFLQRWRSEGSAVARLQREIDDLSGTSQSESKAINLLNQQSEMSAASYQAALELARARPALLESRKRMGRARLLGEQGVTQTLRNFLTPGTQEFAIDQPENYQLVDQVKRIVAFAARDPLFPKEMQKVAREIVSTGKAAAWVARNRHEDICLRFLNHMYTSRFGIEQLNNTVETSTDHTLEILAKFFASHIIANVSMVDTTKYLFNGGELQGKSSVPLWSEMVSDCLEYQSRKMFVLGFEEYMQENCISEKGVEAIVQRGLMYQARNRPVVHRESSRESLGPDENMETLRVRQGDRVLYTRDKKTKNKIKRRAYDKLVSVTEVGPSGEIISKETYPKVSLRRRAIDSAKVVLGVAVLSHLIVSVSDYFYSSSQNSEGHGILGGFDVTDKNFFDRLLSRSPSKGFLHKLSVLESSHNI